MGIADMCWPLPEHRWKSPPSILTGLKATPFWRRHGHFSLKGRNIIVMRCWWNLLELFPLELPGNQFSGVQKKAIHRKMSHGNILPWNFLRGFWGKLLAAEDCWMLYMAKIGRQTSLQELQEPDAGEAVCALRAGHWSSREATHTTVNAVLERPSIQVQCMRLPSECYNREEKPSLLQSY